MDFDTALKKFRPKLKVIAKKLDGKYTSFDENDLYQEAVLHLWQQCNNKSLENKTDSYIIQGCCYFLKNYIRTKFKKIDAYSVHLANSKDRKDINWEDIIPAENINLVLNRIDYNILRNDIENYCNYREARVFDLSLSGFTTREIGSSLGISHVMVIKIRKKIKNKYCNIKR